MSRTLELDTGDGRFVQEAQLTSLPPIETLCDLSLPCSCFSLSNTLDVVSHLVQEAVKCYFPLLSNALWKSYFLTRAAKGRRSLPLGLLCQEPQPGPTTFSAKFHRQTCSSSRRPTACRNLESIKQPAGGRDRGREGGEGADEGGGEGK